MFCLACKDWKPYATFGRHCTTYHKENDSQDVDEIEVADNAEKAALKKRNQREPRRKNRLVALLKKGPKKKKANIDSGKPANP